jgi:restriction endonuclease S subunit
LKSSNLQKLQTGGAMPGINRQDVYKQKTPIPHIEKQQEIVARLDKEMEALEGVRLLRQ